MRKWEQDREGESNNGTLLICSYFLKINHCDIIKLVEIQSGNWENVIRWLCLQRGSGKESRGLYNWHTSNSDEVRISLLLLYIQFFVCWFHRPFVYLKWFIKEMRWKQRQQKIPVEGEITVEVEVYSQGLQGKIPLGFAFVNLAVSLGRGFVTSGWWAAWFADLQGCLVPVGSPGLTDVSPACAWVPAGENWARLMGEVQVSGPLMFSITRGVKRWHSTVRPPTGYGTQVPQVLGLHSYRAHLLCPQVFKRVLNKVRAWEDNAGVSG